LKLSEPNVASSKKICFYTPSLQSSQVIEALLPIKLEVMTLRTATTMRLPLDESQRHRLLQLNELDELQLRAYQSIEVAQAQQKKAFDKKVRRREPMSRSVK
jgi:hypothetical protein